MFDPNVLSGDEIVCSFPPSMRDEVRTKVSGRTDPLPYLGQYLDLKQSLEKELLSLPGIGEERVYYLVMGLNHHMGRRIGIWAPEWLKTVHLLKSEPESFLNFVTSRERLKAHMRAGVFAQSHGQQPLFTKRVVRELRAWIMSWEEAKESGYV